MDRFRSRQKPSVWLYQLSEADIDDLEQAARNFEDTGLDVGEISADTFPLQDFGAYIAALDMFDALADDPDLHLAMQLQTGDMQFVYNHAQLHDRTAFTDWPDPNKRRHLMRLRLSIPEDRPLPECFKSRYGSIEIGNRGDIVTAHTKLHAPLE